MFHIRRKAIKQASLYTDGGKIKYTASLKKSLAMTIYPRIQNKIYTQVFSFFPDISQL